MVPRVLCLCAVALGLLACALPAAAATFAPLASDDGCIANYGTTTTFAFVPCRVGDGLGSADDFALSNDGTSLYAGNWYAMRHFARDPATGQLTGTRCWSDSTPACPPLGHLSNPIGFAVSPDDRFVYVADGDWSEVRAYARNIADGDLTTIAGRPACVGQTSECLPSHGIDDEPGTLVASNQLLLAVSSYGEQVALLRRDPLTGTFSQPAGARSCLSGGLQSWHAGGCLIDPVIDFRDATATITPDEGALFVASESGVSAWQVDPATAALTPVPGAGACIAPLGAITPDPGCSVGRAVEPREAEVSPDGAHLYVAGRGIEVYAIDPATRALSQLPAAASCLRVGGVDGCATLRLPGRIQRLEIAPDGLTVYAVGDDGLELFDRDPATGTLTARPGRSGCYASWLPTPAGCATTGHTDWWTDAELTSDGTMLHVLSEGGDLLAFGSRSARCLDREVHTLQDAPLTVRLDCEGLEADGRTISVVMAPGTGALGVLDGTDGSFTYLPFVGGAGDDSFRLEVTDGFSTVQFDVVVHVRLLAPPVNVALPTITGTLESGQQLTASPGTWTGTAPTSFHYSWWRCSLDGATCNSYLASGADATSVVLPSASVGGQVRLEVTAFNEDGTTRAQTLSGVIVAGAPQLDWTAWNLRRASPAIVGSWLGAYSWSANAGTSLTWERCAPDLSTCSALPGATGTGVTPGIADVGSVLRPIVTATNSIGTVTSTGDPTLPVAHAQTGNTTTPTLTPIAPLVGDTVTVIPGTWSGPLAVVLQYEWFRCDVVTSVCATILDETNSSYVATASDIGSRLKAIVTGDNGVEHWSSRDTAATSLSDQVRTAGDVGTQPPASATAPAVLGAALETQWLQVSRGTWSGHLPMAPSYAWRVCTPGCGAVVGTDSSLELTAAMIGATVEATVTMTNVDGSAAASAMSVVVQESPPRHTNVHINGPRYAGATLLGIATRTSTSAIIGTEHRWQRCTASLISCTDIGGEVGATYVAVPGDAGSAIRYLTRSRNSAGWSGWVVSTAALVTTAPPVNTGVPTIIGTLAVGQALSADVGSWSSASALTYMYRWERCATNCFVISGATATSYVVQAVDSGWRLKLRVTAFNDSGWPIVADAALRTIPSVPVAPPIVSGTGRVGASLTAMSGSWENEGSLPSTHGLQWERCAADGTSCVARAGQVGTSYLVVAGDYGMGIRVVDTATVNGATSGSAASSVLVISVPAAPTLSSVILSAPPREGTAVTVSWVSAGVTPITLDQVDWERCTGINTGCSVISSGIATSYAPTAADVGKVLRARVVVSNAGGSTSSISAHAGQTVAAAAPTLTTPPLLAGTPAEGQLLSVDTGSWSSALPITGYTWTWERCDTAGLSCVTVPATSTTAASSTYLIGAADVGSTLRVTTRANNVDASNEVRSAPSTVVTGTSPTATGTPLVQLTPGEGGTIGTADVVGGWWSGTQPITLSYEWERCAADGSACVQLWSSSSSKALWRDDIAMRLRVTIRGVSSAGTGQLATALSAVVPAPPPTLEQPIRLAPDDIPLVGTSAHLAFSGWTWIADSTVNPTSIYVRWERCATPSSGCVTIATTPSSIQPLYPGLVGSYIRAVRVFEHRGYVFAYPSNALGPIRATDPLAPASPTTLTLHPRQANLVSEATVTASWSFSGAASPTDVYVRQADHAAPFGAWTLLQEAVSATRATIPLGPAGRTTCVRVTNSLRSTAAREQCLTRALDDRQLAARGSWQRLTGRTLYARTSMQTRTRGAALRSPQLRTDLITISAKRCPQCGRIEVSWRGRRLRIVDLRSTTTRLGAAVTLRLPATQQGTLVIRSLDARELVSIDAIGLHRDS